MFKTKISGTGSYVPKKVVTNHDLEKMVETSHDWIVERTGIEERRLADTQNGESNSEMAAIAAKKALEVAGIQADEIDFIIYATCTPDAPLPHSSAKLQGLLGMTNQCGCFDLAAACSGFVYGTVMADSLIKSGVYKNILVVGAEILSSIVDWQDRETCVLFSDGAGAAIFTRSEEGESDVLAKTLGCDGSGAELLKIPCGGSTLPANAQNIENKEVYVQMEGRKVFKYATRTMIGNIQKMLEETKMQASDVDWFIPHQANLRIIEYIGKKLELQMDKVVVTVDKYGNNSSATIPIALDEAIRDGRIKRGNTVAFDAFGAGVTTGAVLLRY